MKTLFMFDLHIIRNDVNEYSAHARRIYDMIRKYGQKSPLWLGIEPYLFVNSMNTFRTNEDFIIRLDDKNRTKLNAMFNTPWTDIAIRQWTGVMRGENFAKVIYFDILKGVLERHGIECVAYWGTNRTIQDYCRLAGIRSVSLELGPTRYPIAPTCYCDFLGVNGYAHTRFADPDRFDEMDTAEWLNSRGIRYESGQRHDAVFNAIGSKFSSRLTSNAKKKVLLGLQLTDDSNCLVHSQYKSMLDMLERTLPRLVKAGFSVFIKPHPAATAERTKRICNYNDAMRCKSYVEANFKESAFWLDDVGTNGYVSLLDKIDATVSINSSIGFESMLFDKPVVALGDAPYAFGNGRPTLDSLCDGSCFSAKTISYQRKICNIMLNYYLYPHSMLANPTIISSAILRNIRLADRFYSDAACFSDAVKDNPIALNFEGCAGGIRA